MQPVCSSVSRKPHDRKGASETPRSAVPGWLRGSRGSNGGRGARSRRLILGGKRRHGKGDRFGFRVRCYHPRANDHERQDRPQRAEPARRVPRRLARPLRLPRPLARAPTTPPLRPRAGSPRPGSPRSPRRTPGRSRPATTLPRARRARIVAFVVGDEPPAAAGFRVLGAHTDSPNLRVKPNADIVQERLPADRRRGVRRRLARHVARPRSLASRAACFCQRKGARLEARLVDVGRVIARVPNLAIHLNRGVNNDGLVLNEQKPPRPHRRPRRPGRSARPLGARAG